MITLKKAFRRDENTVCVMYHHNRRHEDFVVYWNNINETGRIEAYDLQVDCLSSCENLNSIVRKAILEYETDDNEHIDLYLAIRDTFSSIDCEALDE